MKRYKVNVGYTANGRERNRYFATIDQAKAFCERVFAAADVVLCIEAVH